MKNAITFILLLTQRMTNYIFMENLNRVDLLKKVEKSHC